MAARTMRGEHAGIHIGGSQVHLLSGYDTDIGVIPAQVQIAAKSNEIPAFAPLLDRQGPADPGRPPAPCALARAELAMLDVPLPQQAT
ncbi:hypothetical protein [Virgisporangium aurantiacum]|uniref:hypothetical protein n=1 Tax=Virgisporangium aurantiacum TaxID=175570 RepID=UPI001EF22C66|nr:hypothetical protein [Virgisporangium aurantiacum]